ncbi:MAG: RNA polymerase sigma factor [Planctomycetota bacterium]|jgi:RNA polymerase sigma-70 factor (ECF subfamily)
MDEETRSHVEMARGGDRAAFEVLIRKYGRLVYAQAYSQIRRREEAEDVAQETFMKAFQARDQIRDPDKFPQWLLSIARNKAIDVMRKRVPLPLPEEGFNRPDPNAKGPEQGAEAGELREKVFQAIDGLPERHRLAVTLRYLEGMDYKGIEEAMGITNGAVRGILGRTLQALRKSLKPLMKAGGSPMEARLKD